MKGVAFTRGHAGSTRARLTARGFSLIEVQVALVLFALMSVGLAHTLIAAQAARRTSAQWLRATQLAEERLERLRAGDAGATTTTADGFTVASQTTAAPPYVGLRAAAVQVTWTDRSDQTLEIRSLIGERP